MNPLDAIIVEFVHFNGCPLALAASNIQAITQDGDGCALYTVDDSIDNGTYFLIKGTYAENLAIWRKALEPVTATKWIVGWCHGCGVTMPMNDVPGEIISTHCGKCLGKPE